MKPLRHLLTGLAVAALTAPGWSAPDGLLTQRASAIAAQGASVQSVGFRIGGPSQGRSSNGSRQPSADDSAVDAQGQDAFVRVIMPSHSLYVGELAPVQVKAYFRAGTAASLTGLPLLASDAFALGKIGEHPAQSQEMVNGQPFTVLTWDTTLSGVKAGDYPLNIDLPATVRVRQKGRRGAPNPFKDFFGEDSPFGDSSFFDDFFSSFTQKEVTLHTDGAIVKVEPQPAQGRPADFSGAVGDFDIAAEAPAKTAAVGEPFTLKIKVTGKGNFDRVNTPGLTRTADWKTYRPSAKFEPTDANGYSGEKTFEQVVTPARSGAQQIPALSFSYLDPSDGHYVTKHTQPISLEVAAPAPGSASTEPSGVGALRQAQGLEQAKRVETASGGHGKGRATPSTNPLAPKTPPVTQSPIASLHPLVFRQWFIISNAILVLAVAFGAIARRLSTRRSRDPQRLAQEAAARSIHASLASMDDAEKKCDGPGFFLAARHALQEQLAEKWRIAPSQVTGPLIAQRLNGHGESLRSLLRTADEASYSRRAFTAAELKQWHDAFTEELHRLKTL